MKIFITFLTLIISFKSFSAEESIPFPTNPQNLKSCFKAGQDWIDQKIWQASKDSDELRAQFRQRLADCTRKAPEAKQFKLPKEFEYIDKLKKNTFLAQSPKGDWFLYVSEDPIQNAEVSTEMFVQISSKGEVIDVYHTHGVSPYFYGFDFANYDFGNAGKAIGVQAASVTGISLDLAIGAKGLGNNFRNTKFRVLQSADKKSWTSTKCTFQMADDKENDRPQVIEKCRIREAADLNSLKDEKIAKALPDTKRVLRWDGNVSNYVTQVSPEWLEELYKKKHKPAPPKMITKHDVSAEKTIGTVKFKELQETIYVKGHNESAITTQSIEILSGATVAAKKKIQASIAASIGGVPELMDLTTESDDGVIQYGEATASVQVIDAFKNILTLRYSNMSMAAGQRAYDESHYSFYDLNSGDPIDWSQSFKSARDRGLFDFWLIQHFSDQIIYSFPKQVYIIDIASNLLFQIIPKANGVEFIANDNMGGHYFEKVLGLIPYNEIPTDWIKPNQALAALIGDLAKNPKNSSTSPILKPKIDCQKILKFEAIVEKKICEVKLISEYEKLLLVSQKILESKEGDEANQDDFMAWHNRTGNMIAECPKDDRACVLKLIDARMIEIKK